MKNSACVSSFAARGTFSQSGRRSACRILRRSQPISWTGASSKATCARWPGTTALFSWKAIKYGACPPVMATSRMWSGSRRRCLVPTEQGKLTCRWLVDASGRRQFIQRLLKLRRPHEGYSFSTAWFRLAGRWDVEDLVPAENSPAAWPGSGSHPILLDQSSLCAGLLGVAHSAQQ